MGPTEVGDDARSLLRYLHRTFEALRFGPFRRYLGALIWWNAAMSMQMLVRGYLAYDLTGSFAALGLLGIASAVPMLLLSPFGGVVADRTSRRAVLQIGQGFGLAMAVTVALVIFASYLTFWVLLLASVAQGAMMALVMPSRQAYLPEVVGMGRLMNAIPLQSASMNLMQILGGTAGGFLIDWVGAGVVYLAMAAMYAMSVLTLVRRQVIEPRGARRDRRRTGRQYRPLAPRDSARQRRPPRQRIRGPRHRPALCGQESRAAQRALVHARRLDARHAHSPAPARLRRRRVR
jgi:MFS family permease